MRTIVVEDASIRGSIISQVRELKDTYGTGAPVTVQSQLRGVVTFERTPCGAIKVVFGQDSRQQNSWFQNLLLQLFRCHSASEDGHFYID